MLGSGSLHKTRESLRAIGRSASPIVIPLRNFHARSEYTEAGLQCRDQSFLTSVSHCDMYSIAPKTRSIKAPSLFSITEPSQSYRSLFPSPYTPFREICTEQQKRNILEVFHDEEPGSEIDPIVRQPATHPQACGLVCISEGMSRRSHNHAVTRSSCCWLKGS